MKIATLPLAWFRQTYHDSLKAKFICDPPSTETKCHPEQLAWLWQVSQGAHSSILSALHKPLWPVILTLTLSAANGEGEGSRGCSVYPNCPTLSAQDFRRVTRCHPERILARHFAPNEVEEPALVVPAPAPVASAPVERKCHPERSSARLFALNAVERPAFALLALVFAFALPKTAHAQWEIEESHTTASLRGIHNVGGGVAWASGTSGTVLRTLDDGKTWQTCPVPLAGTKDTAEKLDFRGIQAFDAHTAIVMSSGPGDQSRLYKTTDGCQTWKLLFTNPDKDGFWDALQLSADSGLLSGPLTGDPVDGKFPLWWIVPDYPLPANAKKLLPAHHGEAAFAASNTALFAYSESVWLGTGGMGGAHVIRNVIHGGDGIGWVAYPSVDVPVGQHTASSGIFSISFAIVGKPRPSEVRQGVAVGGDYLKPDDSMATSAITTDGGRQWTASTTPPHGYRSAVAYDVSTKIWITVGPNGTDISIDDGRNWRPLTPTPSDAPDADRNWNALSLPFVVGPHGRIGKLPADTLIPLSVAPSGSKKP